MSNPENPAQDLPRQRAELAETVDALRAKLDVSARGKAAVSTQAARLGNNTALRNGAIAAAAVALALIVIRRVRAQRRG